MGGVGSTPCVACPRFFGVAQRATTAVEPAVDRLGRWKGLEGDRAGLGWP